MVSPSKVKALKSTIYHTVNMFKELNSTEDRPRSGRPRTSRTAKVSNAVRARTRRIPKRSMRKMTREMDVSEKTMTNIVKNDLNFSPSKPQACDHLTNLQKEKKEARSSKNFSEQNEVRYGHSRDPFLR